MTRQTRTILDKALTLSRRDRADLVAELLASLEREPHDDPAEVEAAWREEIQRRVDRVLSGESEGLPWESVIAGIRERLAATR
jgi:putative addiction module component (TIGR02574 family)